MHWKSDCKQIKSLHTCFEVRVRVKCIDFVLNLQIPLRFALFFLNQIVDISLCAPKKQLPTPKTDCILAWDTSCIAKLRKRMVLFLMRNKEESR